jgi:hypothetical protein
MQSILANAMGVTSATHEIEKSSLCRAERGNLVCRMQSGAISVPLHEMGS